jgi:hypothetical protein
VNASRLWWSLKTAGWAIMTEREARIIGEMYKEFKLDKDPIATFPGRTPKYTWFDLNHTKE